MSLRIVRFLRIVCAFLFAPAIGAAVYGFAVAVGPWREVAGLLTLMAAAIAYPFVLVVGVPLWLILRGWGEFTLGSATLIGSMIASLAGIAVWFIDPSQPDWSSGVVVLSLGLPTLAGAAGGAAFWIIGAWSPGR